MTVLPAPTTPPPPASEQFRILHCDAGRKRGDGVERTVDPDGTIKWSLNGLYHRVDGPAIEHPSGTKLWFLHGFKHRVDGPAMQWHSGRSEWWLNGYRLGDDEVAALLDQKPGPERDLVATLFAGGVPMADAVATAARLD